MAYIKKLKNNELIGGTDNTDVYPVTSTEAVYNRENVSQEYINNHVDGSKIVNGTITTGKIANGAVSMSKLNNEAQTLIQRGADSSWTPMGDYDVDALYYANDLVFDPETNSSYLSLRADNMGHAVTDETWWMKVLDGSYVNRAIEEMEAAIAQAIEDAQEDIDDAIAGANTAAQTANTAAANAEAKIDWVEEQVDSLTAYEVATALDETSIIPVQNKVVTEGIAFPQKQIQYSQIVSISTLVTVAYNSVAVGLEAGKTYEVFVSSFVSSPIYFYLRKVAANNDPNIRIIDDATGTQLSIGQNVYQKRILFTPTTDEYQYIGIYSPTKQTGGRRIAVNISLVGLQTIKDRYSNVVDDTEFQEFSLAMYPLRQIVISGNGLWNYGLEGYQSRLIQMEDGIYKISTKDSRNAQYAILSNREQANNTAPSYIHAETVLFADSSDVVEGKKGWWLFVRCDEDGYTYGTPTIEFKKKNKIEEHSTNIEDLSLESAVVDCSMTSGYGVIADKSNVNYGNLLTASAGYFYTDYIDISNAVKVKIITVECASNYAGKSIVGAVFYDENKSPLTNYGYFVYNGVGGGNAKFVVDVPSEAKYIRNTSWSTESGITAYYKKVSSSNVETDNVVVRRNTSSIEAIYASKKITKQAVGGSYNYNDPNHMLNFCIAHLSDIHTDVVRYTNFRQFIDTIDGIDAAIHTGDTVIDCTEAQFNILKSINGVKPIMDCVGNHDRGVANSSGSIHTPSLATLKSWIRMNDLYYYQDFTKSEPVKNTLCYKIRVIVLNQYDFDSDGSTHMSSLNATTIYSQTQLDWFVTTLQDALTNGYAVIVAMHTFDGNNWAIKANGKKFFDRINSRNDVPWDTTKAKIIEDIINAFRNAEAIDATYTYINGTSVSVNTSFASKGSFIAYIAGHVHRDMIAYSSKYPDQLYLCGNTGCCVGNYANRPYGTEMSALPRQSGEKSEDCFNVYGIDTLNKTVRVVRVGATMNDYFEPVDYDTYEYEPEIE